MINDYLIHGTNALGLALKYIDGRIEYDPRSVRMYMSVACVTLSELYKDKDTIDLISHAGAVESENQRELFYNFLEEFITVDKAILISAGIDKDVADYLFRDIERTQNIMTNPNIECCEHIGARIQELQDMACRNVDRTEGARNILRRSLDVVGGGALILVNHIMVIKTGLFFSETSKQLGGYVVGRGLDG